MPIFNADTLGRKTAIVRYLNGRIKAPYVHTEVSTLGGVARASAMLTVSADPKSKWANGILQNSRYAMFRIDRDGTIENFHGRLKHMRRIKVKTLPEAVTKINRYLDSVR